MADRPHLVCWSCRQPIPEGQEITGYDGEPYHRGHQPRLDGSARRRIDR